MTRKRPLGLKNSIVDYKKLTPEILKLLATKYPDGYSDTDIITFVNQKQQRIEAIEVVSETTKYLVKISARLQNTIQDFDLEDAIDSYDDDDEPLTTNDNLGIDAYIKNEFLDASD